jgi:hypothetical protein
LLLKKRPVKPKRKKKDYRELPKKRDSVRRKKPVSKKN